MGKTIDLRKPMSQAAVRATLLTGLTLVNSPIVATDTVLQGFGKAQGQINALISAGSTYLKADGSVSLTGNWNAGNFKITVQNLNVTSLNTGYVVLTDGFGNLTSGTPTGAQINFLSGVTSDVQDQLNGKQAASGRLTALAAFSSFGIMVQTASSVFESRTIEGANDKISVSEGDGILGNPIIDISSNYVGQSSITTLGTISVGIWQGSSISTTYTDAKIKTVTETLNRLSITGTATDPIFDISSSYVGQASITTLGTITTGTWNGTTISVSRGGTGSTSFTSGSILYSNGTIVTQNNASLSWDNATSRLNTVNVTLTGILTIPITTSATVGVIFSGVSRFIHNYGTSCTFIGVNAGNFTHTGSNCVAVGANALFSLSNGTKNVAVGYESLALCGAGESNTAIGYIALTAITGGSGNIGIGRGAGDTITLGNNNTVIGYLADVGSNSLSNSAAIGANAIVLASDSMVLGDSAIKVGIGSITTPLGRLHLPGSTTAIPSLIIETGTAPTTPSSGYIWHDSTQKTVQGFFAGVKQSVSTVLFSQTANATNNVQTTSTTILGTGIGTKTLPASFFSIGKTLRITIRGFFTRTSGTLGVTVLLGATTVGASVAATPGGASNEEFEIIIDIACRTIGASGTVMTQGRFLNLANGAVTALGIVSTGTTTIDTTASQTIDVKTVWSAGFQSMTTTNCTIEILN